MAPVCSLRRYHAAITMVTASRSKINAELVADAAGVPRCLQDVAPMRTEKVGEKQPLAAPYSPGAPFLDPISPRKLYLLIPLPRRGARGGGTSAGSTAGHV